ncbi:MAG: PQQ-binding-like beta-propeller repeat protein [Sedimentisphaerales bacterium]|nr:PQQ-binding-like beta-propeller repeat protein [Sedimentisphaerales bacterium]
MICRRISTQIIFVCLLLSARVLAGDWPHWRGPFLNGSSEEKNLPSRWSKTENVAWVVSLPGHSSATPIIAKGKVFVSSTDKNSGSLFALCFNAKNGKEIWRKKLGVSIRKVPRNNPATPSPVTDGKHVYFMYGSGELAGLDYEGNIIWSRNLEDEYGNISLKYGYSSSPLLFNDRLYVLIQRRHTAYRSPQGTGLEAFILAVDAKTGENIWKQARQTDALNESLDSYSSPIPFNHSGRSEILVIGSDYITSNNPATGKEIWRYEYAKEKSTRGRNISSVVTGEGLIFGVPPRGSLGLLALKGGLEGNVSDDDIAWKFEGPAPDVSTPLYYKGNIYVLGDRKGGVVTCLDAGTGRQKWQGTLGGRAPWWASITAGDGKLYCISEAAEAVVLAADEGRFKILSRIDMEDKSVQASIAIADGRLFIRTANKLFCISN